jgi:hypothetical protein
VVNDTDRLAALLHNFVPALCRHDKTEECVERAKALIAAGVTLAATPAPLDGMLGAALLNWYDTTHGNNFGHDHHCPAPWSDEPYTQPIFDGCTCGWSDVQRAEVRRVEEMK